MGWREAAGGAHVHGHISRLSLNSRAGLCQPKMATQLSAPCTPSHCLPCICFPLFCVLVFYCCIINGQKRSSLNNTHLSSHSSVGQKAQHGSTGFSAQNLTGLKLWCHWSWGSHPGLGSSSRMAGCLQTSVPSDCMAEVSVFLLAISQGPPSPPKVHPGSLPCGPPPIGCHILNNSVIRKVLAPFKGAPDQVRPTQTIALLINSESTH